MAIPFRQTDDQGPGSRRSARRSWPPSAGNPQIEPLHLLAALLAEERGHRAARCSRRSAPIVAQLEQIVEAELKHLPKVQRRLAAAAQPAA